MTRRRTIAGVILVAAVVVAAPLVPGVWAPLAYRDLLDPRIVLIKPSA